MRDLPLVTTPRPLPAEAADPFSGVASYAAEHARAAVAEAAEFARLQPDDLRPAVARVLERLASRTQPALVACLRRSLEQWDQADSLAVVDAELGDEISALCRRLADSAQPARTAPCRTSGS